MTTESQFSETLEDFIKNRVPQISKKILREYCIKDQQSEAGQQNQNLAENRIGEVNRSTNAMMDRTGTPTNLWHMHAVCSFSAEPFSSKEVR